MRLKGKKGESEDFETAAHLLMGTIIFTVISVAVFFFFSSQEIEANFFVANLDADKIATRMIFSESCLAHTESYTFDWYANDDDSRKNPYLVRAGIVELSIFENPANFKDRIRKCVSYEPTSKYNYSINLEDFDTAYDITYSDISKGNPDNCGSNQQSYSTTKPIIYPVLIYNKSSDPKGLHNGVIKINISFCYANESTHEI